MIIMMSLGNLSTHNRDTYTPSLSQPYLL
jgi:hypothetical protein